MKIATLMDKIVYWKRNVSFNNINKTKELLCVYEKITNTSLKILAFFLSEFELQWSF